MPYIKAIQLQAFLLQCLISLTIGQQNMTCEQMNLMTPLYQMIPLYVGKTEFNLEKTQQLKGIQGNCFNKIDFSTQFEQKNDGYSSVKVTITIDLEDPLYYLCTENILVGTTFNDYYDFYFFSGKKVIVLDFDQVEDAIDVYQNGIKLFIFCSDPINVLISSVQTSQMFAGGIGSSKYVPIIGSQVPEYMKEANTDFIESFMQTKLQRRVIQDVHINEDLIKDGDILLVRRLDGSDSFLMATSGSHASHCAVALRKNNKLYMVESLSSWYFDSPFDGVQVNLFSDWMDYARAATYEVAWLPLAEDIRQEFDSNSAWEFFEKHQGLPYGYRNMLFGVLDTTDQNYFQPFSAEILPNLLRYLEYYDNAHFQQLFVEALNKRLGIFNKQEMETTLQNIMINAYFTRRLSLQELITLPEQDQWRYSDGEQFTSAAFIVSLFQYSGVFQSYNVTINAKEFTVKDLYQLDFYNTTYERPEQCQEADPHLPYCQLMGEFRIQLQGYSSVEPYDQMNEQCPSVSPDYFRPEGC